MNTVRNIVITATAALLVLAALGMVMHLRQQHELPFPHIHLPVVADAPIVDIGHRALVAELDRRGVLSIRDVELSRGQFTKIVGKKCELFGEFPVCIAADRESKFDDVWAVVKICQSHGIWRNGFIVAMDEKQQGISLLDFYTPLDDMPPSTNNTIVVVARDSVTISDRRVSHAESDRLLARIGTFDRTTPICIRPSSHATFQDVASVLASCARSGLRDVMIERQESAQQDKD